MLTLLNGKLVIGGRLPSASYISSTDLVWRCANIFYTRMKIAEHIHVLIMVDNIKYAPLKIFSNWQI